LARHSVLYRPDRQTPLTSRATIDQPKGIVMGRRTCTSEKAFAVLVDLSSRQNRKLRDDVRDLVQAAATGQLDAAGLPHPGRLPFMRPDARTCR
jgi:hypothetical protein